MSELACALLGAGDLASGLGEDGFGWGSGSAGAAGVSVGVVEGDLVVGVAGDGPAAFVDEAVVTAADREAYGEVGMAAVFPVLDVVGLAGFGAGVAAGDAASAVSGHDRPVLIGRERAGGASHVERYAVGVEHDPLDERIAREAADGVGVELVAAECFATADGFPREGRGIGHHEKVGSVRAAELVIEVMLEDVDDRVGALLGRGARVARVVVAFVATVERGVDDVGAFGVEAAVEDPDPVERSREVEASPFVISILLPLWI